MPILSTEHFKSEIAALINLVYAFIASGSYLEDRFWGEALKKTIRQLMKKNHQSSFNIALEVLQKENSEACLTLIDLIEANSEAVSLEAAALTSLSSLKQQTQTWDALLIAAPILAWTRYTIASGPIKPELQNRLSDLLRQYLFIPDVQFVLVPYLYPIHQLPQTHCDIWKFTQKSAQNIVKGSAPKFDLKKSSETSMIADMRFLLIVAVVPEQAPIFVWQTTKQSAKKNSGYLRENSIANWQKNTQAIISELLPACEFRSLLPDAYYAAVQNAHEGIRPLLLRSSLTHLQESLSLEAKDLRIVLGNFGEEKVEEYRIAFTLRGHSTIIYGVVWPLFPHDDPEEILEEALSFLKASGIKEIRRLPECYALEYCEDCGMPLYADPLGEIVHPEIPDDLEVTPPQFH